eukprot:364889-Chlamydomonas_euryale.AAC.5
MASTIASAASMPSAGKGLSADGRPPRPSPEEVIGTRHGHVLIKQTVLKADHFPSKPHPACYACCAVLAGFALLLGPTALNKASSSPIKHVNGAVRPNIAVRLACNERQLDDAGAFWLCGAEADLGAWRGGWGGVGLAGLGTGWAVATVAQGSGAPRRRDVRLRRADAATVAARRWKVVNARGGWPRRSVVAAFGPGPGEGVLSMRLSGRRRAGVRERRRAGREYRDRRPTGLAPWLCPVCIAQCFALECPQDIST